MEFFIVGYDLPRSMEWIIKVEKILNLRSNTFIILREEGLEDREVILRHLIYYFIKGLKEGVLSRVLGNVENGRLESLGYHIIPVQNFLRQNN